LDRRSRADGARGRRSRVGGGAQIGPAPARTEPRRGKEQGRRRRRLGQPAAALGPAGGGALSGVQVQLVIRVRIEKIC
jgi:hypothetical protein